MQISVLGPLAARRTDDDLVLGGLRQRAVLARLAIAGGEIVPVDRIVDDLWDGEPPPSGVSNLQSYVSNLRRILRDGDHVVIERVGPGYRLEVEAVELVAQRFEALVGAAAGAPEERVAVLDEALALWRGPALVEFADQAWAEAEASRLDELRLSAVEARFQALLDAGQHALAVPDLERAAAEHPLREQLTALLVLALYRTGRQADALRAYERTRAHLADELGLDPVPELVALADRVLAQDPDLTHAASATPETPPAPAAAPAVLAPARVVVEAPLPRAAVVAGREDLVGRDDELARLEQTLAAVQAGATRTTIVAGEAGVGKTSLVGEAVTRAHAAGALVLWGGCAPEHLVAYQPILSALRGLDREADGSTMAVLAARHPVLEQLLGHQPGRAAAERDAYELYEAVAGLLVDLSTDRPLVLVVDDLHWADRSSLALLDHLLAEDRVPALGLLGTVRRPAGRPTEDLNRFIAIARRRAGTDVLELGGVDAAAVGELLDRRGRTVEAAVAEAVHARTGGNPLFVEALSAQADDLLATDPRQLPHTVRETLDLRTAELDADDLQLLVTAAAIGPQVDLHLLSEVAQAPLDRVLDVVDVGVRAGLLREDGAVGVVAFSHALARDALIARSTRTREAQLHLRIADALEAGEDDVAAAVVAQHLRAAGGLCDPERAARASLAAAHEAFDVLAPDEARTWARRALHQLDAGGTTVDGDALRWEATSLVSRTSRHLGDRDGFRAALEQLLEHARRSGDALRLAHAAEEAALGTSNVGFSFGAVDDDLLALLDEARAAIAAAPGDHPVEEATVLAWSSIARAGTPGDRQRELAAAAAKAAVRCHDCPEVQALSALAQRLAAPGPAAVEERLALHDVMLAAAVEARWTELEVVALVLGIADLLECDRVEEASRLLEVLRGRLGPHHRPGLDTYLHFLDACYALIRGDLAAAEEHSNRGLAEGEAAHGGNATQAWAAEQFIVAWERGQLAGFVPMTEAMAADFPEVAAWRVGHAAALVAAGDPEAARAVVVPLLDGDRLVVAEDLLWSTAMGMLAEVAWATGFAELGRAVAAALAPVEGCLAVSGMGALTLGHLVRHRGLALAAAGDLEAADEALARAIERADSSGFLTWAARARIERADVLDRLGRDGSALRAEGQAMADELGIAPALAG